MIIVFLISLIACSMNTETAVTFTRGHLVVKVLRKCMMRFTTY